MGLKSLPVLNKVGVASYWEAIDVPLQLDWTLVHRELFIKKIIYYLNRDYYFSIFYLQKGVKKMGYNYYLKRYMKRGLYSDIFSSVVWLLYKNNSYFCIINSIKRKKLKEKKNTKISKFFLKSFADYRSIKWNCLKQKHP